MAAANFKLNLEFKYILYLTTLIGVVGKLLYVSSIYNRQKLSVNGVALKEQSESFK